ncbi:sensor domain-containing protein [Croceibacterium soli]|nr:PAS domain-containing protein [Croceibacterium soli]
MSSVLSVATIWGGGVAAADAEVEAPILSPAFLSSALSGAGVGTWQVDMRSGLLAWDATTSIIFGLDPVAITCGAVLPVHPEDQALLRDRLKESLRSTGGLDVIFRGLRADGSVIWLHALGRPLLELSGQSRYIAGTLADVTERRQAADALLESERQLRSVFDNLPGVAYRCELTPPWQMDFINEAVSELTGYEPEEFLSGRLSWESLVEPEDRPLITEKVAQAVSAGSSFELRYRIRGKSEEARWVHERGAVVYSAAGDPLFLEGIIGDIHDQVAAEKKVEETEGRLRFVAKATQDTIWDWDLAADEVRRDAGLTSSDLAMAKSEKGSWLDRVHPDDLARVTAELQRVVAGEADRFVSEYRFLKPDGSYADVLDRGYLIRDDRRQPTRMVGAMLDNTERNASVRALRDREARLQKVFGQALVGIIETDPDGLIRLVNPKFCEILGRRSSELKGRSIAEFTHVDEVTWKLPLSRRKAAAKKPFQKEMRYVRADGEVVWCNVSVSFVISDTGEVESSIILAEDITAKKATTAALRESEMLYQSVLEASADCIKIIDLKGRLQFINMPGVRALELDNPDELTGRHWGELWPPRCRDMIKAALASAREGESVRVDGYCPTARGTAKWWDVSVTPMRNDAGDVIRILAISRDITTQRQTSDQLRWTSEHDSLTELPNRRAFEARLQTAAIRAMECGDDVALLLIDLDHFKHVNDALGHAAGDHLLRVLAQRLRGIVRASDFVARLGGDEFAIIIEGADAGSNLLATGQSILERLRKPVRFEGRLISPAASVGGAVFPADATTANELFKNADIALYALKESGRGGLQRFHGQMREQAQLISSQLSLARASISERSVEPYYQPKVELATGRIVGLEALLRWRHPSRGMQLPSTVAEAFNDYELASKIGDLMQRRVLRDLRGWLDQKIPVGFVAVNASPAEFMRDDFADRLLLKIDEFGVPPGMVEVEVTEHVFYERGPDYVGRALQQLNAAGLRIALDDFGTGYSSLSHIRDYPVDVLKIDRSFVARMTHDAEARAIVSAVVKLAESLKIDVVAEGVETEDQREALLQENCRFAQGYYFGRAMEAGEVSRLIAAVPQPRRVA